MCVGVVCNASELCVCVGVVCNASEVCVCRSGVQCK